MQARTHFFGSDGWLFTTGRSGMVAKAGPGGNFSVSADHFAAFSVRLGVLFKGYWLTHIRLYDRWIRPWIGRADHHSGTFQVHRHLSFFPAQAPLVFAPMFKDTRASSMVIVTMTMNMAAVPNDTASMFMNITTETNDMAAMFMNKVIVPIVTSASPNVMAAMSMNIVIVPIVMIASPNVMAAMFMNIAAMTNDLGIIPMDLVSDTNDMAFGYRMDVLAAWPEERVEPHAPPCPMARNTRKPLPDKGCSEFGSTGPNRATGLLEYAQPADDQHVEQHGPRKSRGRSSVPISAACQVVTLSPW